MVAGRTSTSISVLQPCSLPWVNSGTRVDVIHGGPALGGGWTWWKSLPTDTLTCLKKKELRALVLSMKSAGVSNSGCAGKALL